MSLIKTYLQDIRVKYPNLLDKNEHRPLRFGIVESAIEQTNSPMSIIDEDLRTKAMNSYGRDIEIPVIKKGAITLKSARTCSIGNLENESDMIGLTWVTLVADISMIPAKYATNEVQYMNDLAKKLVLVKEAFQSQMELDGLAVLESAKTQVINSGLVGAGGYAFTGNSIQVPLAVQPTFFNDVEPIQMAGDFYDMPYVLGSTELIPAVNHYINQGQANNTNLNYQFLNKTFRFSNYIPSASGVKSTGFFMENGALGLLTRVDIDSKMGHSTLDGKQWSVERIPGLPFDVGVMYSSTCYDASASADTAHLSATKLENWQFSLDYCFVTPYNSKQATKEGVIKKFEFLTT